MTVFQMVVVGLGVVLGGSVIWGEIPKDFFKRKQPSSKPEPSIEKDVEQEVEKESSVDNVSTISELTQMVIVWENLMSQCKKNNLMQAYNELEKIFPLLVKVEQTTDVRGHSNE
jgi:hypothetical protein